MDEQKKLAQVRHRVWYQRWRAFGEFLQSKPSRAEILRAAHRLVDGVDGYGYMHVAASARESMELVIKDLRLKGGRK